MGALLAGVSGAAGMMLAAPGAAYASSSVLPSICSQTGPTVTCTYAYTGAPQQFPALPDLTANVTVSGASGGAGGAPWRRWHRSHHDI